MWLYMIIQSLNTLWVLFPLRPTTLLCGDGDVFYACMDVIMSELSYL